MMKKLMAAAALTFSAATAQAAPLVTDWGYTLTESFIGASFTAGDGTTLTQDSLVSWGATGGDINVPGGDRSGLGLTGDDPFDPTSPSVTSSATHGNVVTNSFALADIGIGPSLTHFNNVLSGSRATLMDATLRGSLSLTPAADGGDIVIDFLIRFLETPNAGPCVPGTGGTPCSDIFVIDAATVLNQPFTYMGDLYFISIFELTAGLVPLSNDICSAAGASNGCLGFVTKENQATTAQFGFAITSRRVNVPEPAALGLLGAGLLGLGLARRRRKA